MNPLHVISKLLQILDISVTYLTYHKVTLASLLRLARLHVVGGAGDLLSGCSRSRTVPARQRSNGNTWRSSLALNKEKLLAT